VAWVRGHDVHFVEDTIMACRDYERLVLGGDAVSLTRRRFLGQSSVSVGAAALSWMLGRELPAAAATAPAGPDRYSGLPGLPHFPARAKRVIFLYMSGGPSHLETFDYKPDLVRLDGQPMPESFTTGQPIAQLQNQQLKCLRPLFPFRKHG
jgi:hypothetical protein